MEKNGESEVAALDIKHSTLCIPSNSSCSPISLAEPVPSRVYLVISLSKDIAVISKCGEEIPVDFMSGKTVN